MCLWFQFVNHKHIKFTFFIKIITMNNTIHCYNSFIPINLRTKDKKMKNIILLKTYFSTELKNLSTEKRNVFLMIQQVVENHFDMGQVWITKMFSKTTQNAMAQFQSNDFAITLPKDAEREVCNEFCKELDIVLRQNEVAYTSELTDKLPRQHKPKSKYNKGNKGKTKRTANTTNGNDKNGNGKKRSKAWEAAEKLFSS